MTSMPAFQRVQATSRCGSLTANLVPVRRPVAKRALRVTALLDFFKPKPSKASMRVVRPTVTLDPSYNLQAALVAIAGLEAWQGWYPVAAFTGLLGVFLAVQASRVSFIFDDEAFEIKRNGAETDNVVVGGRNRWPYSSFVNWELWFPAFPVLVYFKETQTKPEGQIHFFPIIFNGRQLYDVMVERCGPSATSGPK
ncbi:hypothetical protein QJQ45_027560 [Haematococcus lacustris]|nr:hypothetical protein QJQ45_027560 [Haematococcus lacustris]